MVKMIMMIHQLQKDLNYIDNSQSDTDKDAAEELSEEEVVAGFEFETEKVEPEESYLEDVPMFKQKRLEDEQL